MDKKQQKAKQLTLSVTESFEAKNQYAEKLVYDGWRQITPFEADNEVKRLGLEPVRPPKNEKNAPVRKYVWITLDGRYAAKLMTAFVDDYPAGPNKNDSVKLVITHLPTDIKVFKIILYRTKHLNKRVCDYARAFSQGLSRLPVCDDPNCHQPHSIVSAVNFEDLPTVVCPNAGNKGHMKMKPQSFADLLLGGNHKKVLLDYVERRKQQTLKMAGEGKVAGSKEKKHKSWKKNSSIQNPELVRGFFLYHFFKV